MLLALLSHSFNSFFHPGYKNKAMSYEPPYKGVCAAWESAQTGVETCPLACHDCGSCVREIHINGDIPLAIYQYYAMNQDPKSVAK